MVPCIIDITVSAIYRACVEPKLQNTQLLGLGLWVHDGPWVHMLGFRGKEQPSSRHLNSSSSVLVGKESSPIESVIGKTTPEGSAKRMESRSPVPCADLGKRPPPLLLRKARVLDDTFLILPTA